MAEVEIAKASKVKVREIEWLWYPYIPFGKVTVVQGDAGDGKSTFVLNLAANEVRRKFRPLIEIAKEQRCAILIVYHMNKNIGQKAINRAVGSVK